MTPAATVIACLTPPGRGAIATLGVRGAAAWSLVRALFRPAGGALPEVPDSGRFWLGRLGEPADDAVLAVRSMRPVPCLDIHCHGGTEVVRLLQDLFCQRGARIISWDEWEQQPEGQSLCHRARALLPRAPTVRTAAILLDQAHGALSEAIQELAAAVRHERLPQAVKQLDDLLRHETLARHLIEPWQIVIAGAPNAGKSSLVNALAGFERSVVAPSPGTTRDVVGTILAIDGWPVEVSDTAGWRSGAESLETEGIARARTAAAEADVCLWVLDAAAPPALPATTDVPVHFVINKIDLPAAWDLGPFPAAPRVSAKVGSGLSDLCHFIAQTLVPAPPAPGAAVPFTGEVADALRTIRQHLAQGKSAEALAALEALSR